jgi:hypothetical protein
LRKESLRNLRLSKGVAKHSDGLGIGDALIEVKPQKSHEGQTGANLRLGLIIGQVVEGLQDENFEHEYGIKGRASTFISLGAAGECRESGTKFLPGGMGSKRF